MKHPRLARTGPLLSALLLSVCQLSACLPAGQADTPPVGESAATIPQESHATESALRTYYESLIADLNQALLEAKQDDYITKKEYESRIAELEARIEALQEPSDILGEATDVPVSSTPTPPEETTPPTATSAFTYTVENGTIAIRAYRGTDKRVTVPDAIAGLPVTRIADDAFRASAVTSVTLPDTVIEIGWFSFADCRDLIAVSVPASVIAIGYGAFESCPSLTVLCPKDSYAKAYAESFGIATIEIDP